MLLALNFAFFAIVENREIKDLRNLNTRNLIPIQKMVACENSSTFLLAPRRWGQKIEIPEKNE